MSEESAGHSVIVDLIHSHTRKVIEGIGIKLVEGNGKSVYGVYLSYHGLKHSTASVLNELTERVKIGGEGNGCGENTLSVLTLTFAVKLLPPLVEHRAERLVANHDLGGLALAVEDVADGGVLVAVVCLDGGVLVGLHGVGGALHEAVNVDAYFQCTCAYNTFKFSFM